MALFAIIIWTFLVRTAEAADLSEINGGAEIEGAFLNKDAEEKLRIIANPVVDSVSIANLGIVNATAEAAAELLQGVQGLGILDPKIIHGTGLVVFEATRDEILNLIDNNEIESFAIDEELSIHLNSAGPVVDAPFLHTTQGVRGVGKTVVVLDTGVDQNHPFFGGRVVHEACFSTNTPTTSSLCPNGSAMQTGVGSSGGCPQTTPGCNHGTHVAGIAAGDDGFDPGMAPDASIIAIQIFSLRQASNSITAFTSDIVAALAHVENTLMHQHPIASVNMSIGTTTVSGDCPNNTVAPYVRRLRGRGIATVISSGNGSSTAGVSFPGCIPSAITVGSSDDFDNIAGDSNSSSTVDLVAPGVSIRSSVFNAGFANMSGTSMAAPMVAGAIAALQSLYTVSVDEIELILEASPASVVDSGDPANVFTFPRLNLRDAWDRVDQIVPSGEFVWIRDTWADSGGEPDANSAGLPMSGSPDIWVRNQQDGIQNPHQQQNAEFGSLNWLYALLRNSGKGQATGTLQLYIAKANINEKASWSLITSVSRTIAGQGRSTFEIPWGNVPSPDHYCLLARWVPSGGDLSLTLPGGLENAVRMSNDIAWKNINIVDQNSTNSLNSSIQFVKNADGSANLVIEVDKLAPGQLDEIGSIILDLGADPGDLSLEPTSKYYTYEGRYLIIPLRAGVYYVPDINLPSGEPTDIKITFDLRNERIKVSNSFAVSFSNIRSVSDHKEGRGGYVSSVRYLINN